ncbi:MAG: hypothetical protein ACLR2E_03155 [Lachnospiraceae bacterium]
MQKTDAAFKELTEYFATQDEPTVILMFGDHQPSDYICNPILRLLGQDSSIRESSVDELRKGYVVPSTFSGPTTIWRKRRTMRSAPTI